MPRWCYWVSGFFVLDTMQAFGFLSRMVYGSWSGKTGDHDHAIPELTDDCGKLDAVRHQLPPAQEGLCRGQRPGPLGGRVPVSVRSLVVGPADDRPGRHRLPVRHPRRDRNRPHHGCRRVHASAQLVLLPVCNRFDLPARCLPQQRSHVVQTNTGRDARFIGIFPQKNVLGQVMATGVLATLHGIRVARRRYLGKLFMLLVFLGMAYASKSTTALMAALLFCGISGFDSLWRKGSAARLTGVIFAVFLAPVLIVAVAAPDTFLEMIGKDPTLTGRTEIWAYVDKDIWMKPWLGWGYFVFWQLSNPYALEISNAMHWVVPNAHNGLLECLLNVGVLGTALFAFILIRTIVLAVRCLRTAERALAISTISCCAGILLMGVSETVLLTSTQSSTPVMFITGLMCERALYVAKGQRRYRVADSRGQISRSLSGSRRPLGAQA